MCERTCRATCCYIHVSGRIDSSLWHDAFICLPYLVHTCNLTHLYVWHDVYMCVTCCIHMCDVWHDAFTCVTWRFRSHVWHDAFICVTWLIQEQVQEVLEKCFVGEVEILNRLLLKLLHETIIELTFESFHQQISNCEIPLRTKGKKLPSVQVRMCV